MVQTFVAKPLASTVHPSSTIVNGDTTTRLEFSGGNNSSSKIQSQVTIHNPSFNPCISPSIHHFLKVYRIPIMLVGSILFLSVLVGGIVGGTQSMVTSSSTSSSSFSTQQSSFTPLPVTGTIATVYLHPSSLPTLTPCDSTVNYDIGCNTWWKRDDSWAVYQQVYTQDFYSLLESVGGPKGSPPSTRIPTSIIYFPLFLADTSANGNIPLSRLSTVIQHTLSCGLQPLLFLGRPEYYGVGNSSQTHDIVHDSTARKYFLSLIQTVLTLPIIQSSVNHVTVYWLGAAYFCTGSTVFCTPNEIMNITQDIQNTVHSYGKTYLQHVDGPFWDGCYPAPCPNWNVHGYNPQSLINVDGIIAESWVQGSLVNAVNIFLNTTQLANTSFLLLTDVPNCDLYPSTHPCSTGNLLTDVSTWFNWLPSMNLYSNTWGVWSGIDGALGLINPVTDGNYYGDILSNGTGLTAKGLLHRNQAIKT